MKQNMSFKEAFLLALVPLLLVNITLVTSGNAPVPSPEKSPVPPPPFFKPVPAPPLPPTKASPPPPLVYKPVPPSPPVQKPTLPPPPAKVTPPPTPPPKVIPPPTPPPKVTPPLTPPAKVSPPPPPPPRPRTTKDCIPLCGVRCKLHSRKNVCLRVCVTCCDRCKCVPPGQYGNREKCGKCYTDMTTRGGRPKCP